MENNASGSKDEKQWNRMEQNGTEWNRMEQNGTLWNAV